MENIGLHSELSLLLIGYHNSINPDWPITSINPDDELSEIILNAFPPRKRDIELLPFFPRIEVLTQKVYMHNKLFGKNR